MTIFEYIKSMTVEQLAEYLKDEHCDQRCAKHCKEWLESELTK